MGYNVICLLSSDTECMGYQLVQLIEEYLRISIENICMLMIFGYLEVGTLEYTNEGIILQNIVYKCKMCALESNHRLASLG